MTDGETEQHSSSLISPTPSQETEQDQNKKEIKKSRRT